MVGNSKIDSIKKRDFIKIYHRHGAEVNNENQNIKLYFEENMKNIRIGDGYLDFDIEVKKVDNTNFTSAGNIRLVNNGLAYAFQEGRIFTSSATEIENKKH